MTFDEVRSTAQIIDLATFRKRAKVLAGPHIRGCATCTRCGNIWAMVVPEDFEGCGVDCLAPVVDRSGRNLEPAFWARCGGRHTGVFSNIGPFDGWGEAFRAHEKSLPPSYPRYEFEGSQWR